MCNCLRFSTGIYIFQKQIAKHSADFKQIKSGFILGVQFLNYDVLSPNINFNVHVSEKSGTKWPLRGQ
jgi:hypothetical protein